MPRGARVYHAGMASRRLPSLRAARRGSRRGLGALPAAAAALAGRRPPAPDPSWWAADARLLVAERSALATASPHASAPGSAGWSTAGPGGRHRARRRPGRPLRGAPRQHHARDATAAVARAQQVLLITARAPVGSPLLHVTALGADGVAHVARRPPPDGELGHVRVQRGGPRAGSGPAHARPRDGAAGRGRSRARGGERAGRGRHAPRARRRAPRRRPPGGRAPDGRRRPVRAAHGHVPRCASDAATISVWIRGIAGLRPSVDAECGRALARLARSPARRGGPVRVPVAALRGRRVALSVESKDATGLQLAYVGTVQRAPALRVKRFVPAAPDAPAGESDRRRGDRLAALAGVRVTLEQRRGAAWQRVGAAN